MDNLTAEQLQQLSNLATMQYGMQAQAQTSAYRPQFSVSDMMAAGTGQFSFGQRLGQTFGQGGAQLGMMADVALPMFLGPQYTDFMARLNMNAGADILAQQGARRYQSLVGTMGTGDIGRLISNELGLSGTSYDPYIQSFAPVVDMMTGGMVSDVARMIDPTLMTQQGAMALISAQRRTSPVGRLDENQVMAMKAQLQDRISMGMMTDPQGRRRMMSRQEAMALGVADANTPGFSFRDDVFTSGFNADEFADIMAIAADVGVRDFAYANGVSDASLRAQARAQISRRQAAGETIAADEATTTRIMDELRSNAALMGGASNMAQIMQSMRGAFGPNLSTGELGNMMVSMGLTPGNAGDVANIRGVIEELRALGEAAGLSADQMRTAGQALQQQFGGSQAFTMGVAGMMGVTNRMFRDVSVEQGRGFTAGEVTAELTSRMGQQELGASAAPLTGLLAAVEMDPTLRGQFDQIMREDGPGAAAAFLRDLSQTRGGLVRRASEISPARRRAAEAAMRARHENFDMGSLVMHSRRLALTNEVRQRGRALADIGGGTQEVGLDFFTRLGELSGEDMDLFGQAFASTSLERFSEEEVTRLQGMSDRLGGGQDIRALLNVARRGGAVSDLVMTFMAERGLARTADPREAQIRRREVARMLSLNGMGQRGMGAVLDLLRGGDIIGQLSSIEGIAGVLTQAGVLRTGEEAALIKRLQDDPEVGNEMIQAFQQLERTKRVVDNAGARATEEQRKAFQAAKDRITSLYGIGQDLDMNIPKKVAGEALGGVQDFIGNAVDAVKGYLGFGTDKPATMDKGKAGANADGDPGTGGTAAEDVKSAKVQLDVDLRVGDGLVVSANQAQSVNNGVKVNILNSQSASREMSA